MSSCCGCRDRQVHDQGPTRLGGRGTCGPRRRGRACVVGPTACRSRGRAAPWRRPLRSSPSARARPSPFSSPSCQFMIIRVVASSSGSGTYFVIGNCDLPQTTGFCPQSSGGKRSSRGESTFSTALLADDGYEKGRIYRRSRSTSAAGGVCRPHPPTPPRCETPCPTCMRQPEVHPVSGPLRGHWDVRLNTGARPADVGPRPQAIHMPREDQLHGSLRVPGQEPVPPARRPRAQRRRGHDPRGGTQRRAVPPGGG